MSAKTGGCAHCLAKSHDSHLVREDAVQIVPEQSPEPQHGAQLVREQRAGIGRCPKTCRRASVPWLVEQCLEILAATISTAADRSSVEEYVGECQHETAYSRRTFLAKARRALSNTASSCSSSSSSSALHPAAGSTTRCQKSSS